MDKNAFAKEVNADIVQAQTHKINGVPYFIINNQYAISGAQESSVFLQSLQKAHAKWSGNIAKPIITGMAK